MQDFFIIVCLRPFQINGRARVRLRLCGGTGRSVVRRTAAASVGGVEGRDPVPHCVEDQVLIGLIYISRIPGNPAGSSICRPAHEGIMRAARLFLAECQRDILLFGLFCRRFRAAVGIVSHPIGRGCFGGIEIAYFEAPGTVPRLCAFQIDAHCVVIHGHSIPHQEISGINTDRDFLPICDNHRVR